MKHNKFKQMSDVEVMENSGKMCHRKYAYESLQRKLRLSDLVRRANLPMHTPPFA